MEKYTIVELEIMHDFLMREGGSLEDDDEKGLAKIKEAMNLVFEEILRRAFELAEELKLKTKKLLK